jgi:hypothetical protein
MIMRVFYIVLMSAIIVILGVDLLSAQPLPALPTAPNQAPIDGGLGLLAAAGGAYAWRQLRRK